MREWAGHGEETAKQPSKKAKKSIKTRNTMIYSAMSECPDYLR
jgi:hypothetical protein